MEIVEDHGRKARQKSGSKMAIIYTVRDKCYEVERSFKPTFAVDLLNRDKVKSLRVICASKIRRFGDQIRIDGLPYECQVLIKYLPKLLSPHSTVTKTNDQEITKTITKSVKKKRVLPSWMTKETQHGD